MWGTRNEKRKCGNSSLRPERQLVLVYINCETALAAQLGKQVGGMDRFCENLELVALVAGFLQQI